MGTSVGWYRRWRHAGEEGALAIYDAVCWSPPFAVGALALAIIMVALHLGVLAILPLAFVYCVVPDLANFRRALIFTSTSLRYRTTFGGVRDIPLEHIFVVRQTVVTVGRPGVNSRAAALSLPFGETLTISLNMHKGQEALQRLLKIANSAHA